MVATKYFTGGLVPCNSINDVKWIKVSITESIDSTILGRKSCTISIIPHKVLPRKNLLQLPEIPSKWSFQNDKWLRFKWVSSFDLWHESWLWECRCRIVQITRLISDLCVIVIIFALDQSQPAMLDLKLLVYHCLIRLRSALCDTVLIVFSLDHNQQR